MGSLKRILVGQPIATDRAEHEKIPKIIALPVFASDAISSVAYATEAIMGALIIAGTGTFGLTPWLSLGIVLLLVLIAVSYRQTIAAYPNGGGSYIVARDNLGDLPAQVAGASLLIDYVLTVAVSIAAGVLAISSLLQNSGIRLTPPEVVLLCVAFVLFIAVMNLRGVRESGMFFAIPTYSFIAIMYVMVAFGIYKIFLHQAVPAHAVEVFRGAHATVEGSVLQAPVQGISHLSFLLALYLILHAFASGCTALTGVEAISNGVPAFRAPESQNASTTMTWMAIILGTIFLGLSYLAVHLRALPPNAILPGGHIAIGESVLSQVGRAVFDSAHSPFGKILYWFLQIATALILVLAANTSFADFPRLASIMARDGFLPRQFANIGDKLVFDRGIAILAILSIILIVTFRGSVEALIPLYAIGVFLSFTLSQSGMVKRWFRLKSSGWKTKAAVNGLGAIVTCIVALVFAVVKFSHGAWVVIVILPLLVSLFLRIHAHYRSVAKQLSLEGYRPRQGLRQHVLVLAPDIHRGVIPALQYARAISPDARGVHVSIDPTREARVRKRWTEWSRGVPLVILPSPYRSLVHPVLDYIDRLQAQEPNSQITVVVPEFVSNGWFAQLLHGQASLSLKMRLLFKPGVIVTSVPYHIEAFVDLPHETATPAAAEH